MSKYVNLASKIIDLVHAEHKAGLRAERKKTAEAKAKKVKELDPTVDDDNPGFKDKEQEDLKARMKDAKKGKKFDPFDTKAGDDVKDKKEEESEDDEKEDEDDDPVGKKKEKDDSKDGEEDKEDDGEDEKEKDAPPAKGEEEKDEGPDPSKQTGRETSTGAVDIQKKPSPATPGVTKKTKGKKVEMTGKKEKVDLKPKSESLDDQIRKREEALQRPKFSVEQFKQRIQLKERILEIDDKFGIKEKMISEGMWDGNVADSMEIYGKPEITQLQLYRMLELYRAAGMTLDQSCDTIEYLYGVRPVSDQDGNMNFGGTQMDIQKYGRNDGSMDASYYK